MQKEFEIEVNDSGDVVIIDTYTRQLSAREIENEIYKVEDEIKFLKTQAAAIQRDWHTLNEKKKKLEQIQAQISDEITIDGDLFEDMK